MKRYGIKVAAAQGMWYELLWGERERERGRREKGWVGDCLNVETIRLLENI